MKREAFRMRIKPGAEELYKKRHDEIWPELSQILSDAGISDYTIYLDEESLMLFAHWTVADDHSAADLPNNPMVRKWWDFMAELMDVHDDNSPICQPLKRVFYMK